MTKIFSFSSKFILL